MEHEYISASACDYKEIVGPDSEGLGIEGSWGPRTHKSLLLL